ncbi:hypothetical protein FA13DRAFT_1789794 [Coprinellus micaceus]|uniref:Uncharacterized protein n=1 Tax=Coprinellus micaceus TaxID=71717 RepID=A0A4Y7THD6_COPMI|nr:hypothetical protein FA13DRAFT_1789794 [Coprinellus micaceus]
MSTSSNSSGSMSSNSELPTPPSSMGQRISIPSPSTSPILSYFMAQSPAKSAPSATFPLRRGFPAASPVFEADELAETERVEPPVAAHARRASINAAHRFSGQNPAVVPESLQERGSGLLRRLSLSSAGFAKPLERTGSPPRPPPNSAVGPGPREGLPYTTKPRRSATVSTEAPKTRRAPSPMGERILKGHFDGFN